MSAKQMLPDQCVPLHWFYGGHNCCLCKSSAEGILLRQRIEELERERDRARAATRELAEEGYKASVWGWHRERERLITSLFEAQRKLDVVKKQWQEWQPTKGGPTWWTAEFEAVVTDVPLETIFEDER